jgi:hypothetical protein
MVLVLLGLLFVSQVSQASECKVIKTRLDGSTFLCADSPVGVCADGTITSGILKGTKFAFYTAAAPSAGLPTEPPSVLSYSAYAVFTTKHGDLHLSQLGVSDTERQVFTELNRVVGGTGRFYEASGELFISGTFSSPDIITDFESEITGTLCLPHWDD